VQLASAEGLTVTDYVKKRIALDEVQKKPVQDFNTWVQKKHMETLRRDAETGRGRRYASVLREYPTVGKRVRIVWWTRPLTEYDALQRKLPEQAGKWELRLQKETKHPDRVPPIDPRHVEGDWYMETQDTRFYRKRVQLYRAINSLCKKYGVGSIYPSAKPRAKPAAPGGTP